MEGLNQSQRREVVSLILSLTSNVSTSPGDLGPIYERLQALETRVTSLDQSFGALADPISSLSSDLSEALTALGEVTSQLTSIALRLSAVEDSVTVISSTLLGVQKSVGANTSAIASMNSTLSSISSRVDNLSSDVSRHSLSITDLTERVVKLEQGGGADLTFNDPLKLEDGVVSLQMDPSFVSADPLLTNYSSKASLMIFKWLARADSGGAVTFNVNAHAHGSRTDVIMSTLETLTVTGTTVQITMDLNYVVDRPEDLAKLIPSGAFQGASFPIELTYQRDSRPYSFQVYGTFTAATSFQFSFTTSGTGAGILTYLTVRYGIDT